MVRSGAMEGGVRVRLRFEQKEILSETQKAEGLKRCWLLLPPQLSLISDLSSFLLDKFSLHDSCPNGLLLYMDGFILPPFESTCIVKDKDLVRIKKKGQALPDDGANCIEDSDFVEKQSLLTGAKLLAIEGSNNKAENKHEEPLVDALPLNSSPCSELRLKKKRKRPEDLQSPKGLIGYCLALAKKHNKRRKSEPTITKKMLTCADGGAEKDARTKQKEKTHRKGAVSSKCSHKKDKANKPSSSTNDGSNAINGTGVAEVENIDVGPSAVGEKLQVDGVSDTSHMLDGTKKYPSRSARRKKAKRKWLRELAESQRKEDQVLENEKDKKSSKHQRQCENTYIEEVQMLENGKDKKSPKHQPRSENPDIEEEAVPVEIRPGHIRFQPLGTEHSNCKVKDHVETFQWIGTTSKKKGQKWGISKSFARRDFAEDFDKKSNIEEGEITPVPGDFEKLAPLSGKPMEGDVLAYRLVELSSSWCPELSTFRIGKISSYDPLSQKAILLPVPEYPVVLDEKKDEAVELLSTASLYSQDGSLEIDFASLVDVRVISRGKAVSIAEMTGNHVTSRNGQEAEVGKHSNNSAEVVPSPGAANSGEVNPWDALSQTLIVKKTQLLQKNSFGNNESSVKRGWSNRAMRSSALGPTMALLRSQNDL